MKVLNIEIEGKYSSYSTEKFEEDTFYRFQETSIIKKS